MIALREIEGPAFIQRVVPLCIRRRVARACKDRVDVLECFQEMVVDRRASAAAVVNVRGRSHAAPVARGRCPCGIVAFVIYQVEGREEEREHSRVGGFPSVCDYVHDSGRVFARYGPADGPGGPLLQILPREMFFDLMSDFAVDRGRIDFAQRGLEADDIGEIIMKEVNGL